MDAGDYDVHLRSAAFDFLGAVSARLGGPVKYDDVAGFVFQGERIPLMPTQQGIRKPRQLQAALEFPNRARRAARPASVR